MRSFVRFMFKQNTNKDRAQHITKNENREKEPQRKFWYAEMWKSGEENLKLSYSGKRSHRKTS